MLCLRLLGQRHIIASSWLCKTDVCKQLSTIGLYFISRMPWVPPQVFSDMTAMIAFGVEWSTGLLGPMWFSGLGFDSLVIFPAKTCSRLKVFKVESVQTFLIYFYIITFNSLARMKQWMSDANWLGRPLLFLPANEAAAAQWKTPPGLDF